MMFGFMKSKGKVPASAPDPTQPHELALYRSGFCGFCRRVEHAVGPLDLEIEMRDVNESSEHRRDLQAKTGRTTVPCLFIDGQPMFESLDIIAWLEAHAAARA